MQILFFFPPESCDAKFYEAIKPFFIFMEFYKTLLDNKDLKGIAKKAPKCPEEVSSYSKSCTFP